tara:strand:+ start:17877 stop:21641 length:3765 start_codon:yes stop_codon:yes gene_type:complete
MKVQTLKNNELKAKISEKLNPNNLQIDDRKIEDLIIFTFELSKKINFFDIKNKKNGHWDSLIELDDTFLIAQVIKFDLQQFDIQKLNLIKKFDDFSSQEEKEIIFKDLFNLISHYFETINKWYFSATRNITSVESSDIELELEQAIDNKLKTVFTTFIGYYLGLQNNPDYTIDVNVDLNDYLLIWRANSIEPIDIFSDIDPRQSKLSSALKKLILLYNPVYSILNNIQLKSKPLFEKSIIEKSNHKAHIGLLLSFFKLFKNAQNDINSLSKKHLDLYYRNILDQNSKDINPKKMYVNFEINQNQNSINIEQGASVIAGQYENGNDIIYNTDNEINLNNIKISELRTFFVSKNSRFDYNSNFKLVSGIYSKTHCLSIDEVNKFNEDDSEFSTLGEEQYLKTEEYQTMDVAAIGFAISSATLALAQSNRKITFKIQFTPNSIKTLTNLIIDISNQRGLSEEEIFAEIFNEIFVINYTNEEGWVKIDKYTIVYPYDWSTGEIEIEIELNKRHPSVDTYNEVIHLRNFNTKLPLFQFLLNSTDFYHSYSFLTGMNISKIDVEVKVNDLSKISGQNKQGSLDLNGEFELLGATPSQGSSIIIGSNELFCKPIDSLSLRWDYKNLPLEFKDLKDYYANYNRNIQNDSFKLKLSALSDFTYKRIGSKDFEFEMFNTDSEGKIKLGFELKDFETSSLNLKPKYDLKYEDIEEYSKESETGFLKLELVDPIIGFGFDIFNKIYSDSMLKASKSKKEEEIIPPNQPWAPSVENLLIDYKSKTSLYFNQSLIRENDFEQQNAFFLVSNQGVSKTFSEKKITSSLLIPEFEYVGEFIIGLEKIKAPQTLNLLFEVKKSENTDYQFSQKLEWLYSSNNNWKKFSPNQIIYDETLSLMKSGVISLSLPQDISNNSQFFNNDKFYIKAVSRKKADQFSLIKAIYTNALTLTELIPNDTELTTTPPRDSGSVQQLASPIGGVIRINQALPAFGGNKKETDLQFYNRVSQMLRHKDRPVTKWDIEQFLLEKFKWLMYVKCIATKSFEDTDENQVKILCLKKIDDSQNIDEIKLNGADMLEVKKLLYQYCSPFLKVEIINPVFEDLWIKCKIKFSNISGGQAINKLNNDFFKFICPWVGGNQEIKNTLKKTEIFQFIKNLHYVNYVTGLSIIHFKTLENGNVTVFDSSSSDQKSEIIEVGSPWSILVPRNNNKLEIIDIPEYSLPEPIDYNELNIEGNFIINSGNKFSDSDLKPQEEDIDQVKNLSLIKLKL